MGQRHVCTFRHAQRAAYRTAISAAQILVYLFAHKALHKMYCHVQREQDNKDNKQFHWVGKRFILKIHQNTTNYYYPRRARSAIGVDTVFTLDV